MNLYPGLENVISQKIMKVRKDKSGFVLSKKPIGYFVAGIADDFLVIGYSMCHHNDEYDVVNGRRVSGFGKYVAYSRAIKWANDSFIEVPISIKKDAQQFVERCEKYYKGFKAQDVRPQRLKR